MLYSYQKATPDMPSPGKLIPRYLRILPTLVSSIGLGLVASVVWPMVSYNLSLKLNSGSSKNTLLSPIIYESFASEVNTNTNEPTLIADVDYTKASNWFTFSPADGAAPPPVGQSQFIDLNGQPSTLTQQPIKEEEYRLAIPSLGIKEAIVKANIDDLAKSLIQYQQTAFPGEVGAPVIFGHSTLPQFFNPENYLTIFSTLPTIKIGADIFVDYAGVKYTYRVSSMYEVKPTEFWVLKQDYTKKIMKLITCVPPGTKLRRLVVEAELIKS
ncbi:sortase [Candidatus Collierbacteria bacterium]|nr:sortase [Candidatus Collierbacteria bacterium]